MSSVRFLSHIRITRAVLAVMIVAGCGVLIASAQDTRPPVGVSLEPYKKAEKEEKPGVPKIEPKVDEKLLLPGSEVSLRPNAEQPVYITVKNPLKQEALLSVKLVHVKANGDRIALGSADVGKLAPEETKQVTGWKFTPPTGPKAPVGQPPPPPVLDTELDGPTHRLEVEVFATTPGVPVKPGIDDKPQSVQPITFRVMQPQEYVKVLTDESNYTYDPDKKKGLLVIKLNAVPAFAGPECPVALDLRPLVAQGLILDQGKGTLKGTLTKAKDTVLLTFDDMKFSGDPPRVGVVDLSVDGYERAHILTLAFDRSGTPERVEKTALRLLVDRYVAPADFLKVRLEVDNPPTTQPITLKVGIDRDRNGTVDETELKPLPVGDRATHVRMKAEDAALLIKPIVTPWVRELPIAGLQGDFALRGTTDIKYKKDGKDVIEALNAAAIVTIDPTPPLAVVLRAGGVARQVKRGELLSVTATAEEAESEIVEALFFFGKPLPDGKLPEVPKVKGLILPRDKSGIWMASAKLEVPAELKGKFDVSVRMTNSVGMSTIQTVRVEVVEPDNKPVKPSIEGIVVEWDRPQSGVAVQLRDATNAVKGQTATDADGKYAFTDLVPGTYRVFAGKPTGSRGNAVVDLKENEKKIGVDIKLAR
jgi:hypothetical protein